MRIKTKSCGKQLKKKKKNTDIKPNIDLSDKDLTPEAIVLIKEIKIIEENVDYEKLSFTGSSRKVYGLDSFKTFEKLIKDVRNKNMTIDKTQEKQNKFADKLDDLRAHPGRGSKYIDLKVRISKNLKKISDRWLKIVDGFKTGILPFSKIDGTKTDSGDEQGNILDTPKQERFNDFLNHIKEEEKIIDATLFRNIFDYDTPDKMLQTLHSL